MPKRLAQIAILLIASVTMLGAGSPSTRFDKLGHKLMCTCGCAEILLECNHMGCPDSPKLIADLHAQVDAGGSDSGILSAFAAKYGPIVLAAPIRGGFDLVAWIVPFAVLAIGLVGITWLLRHWRERHMKPWPWPPRQASQRPPQPTSGSASAAKPPTSLALVIAEYLTIPAIPILWYPSARGPLIIRAQLRICLPLASAPITHGPTAQSPDTLLP